MTIRRRLLPLFAALPLVARAEDHQARGPVRPQLSAVIGPLMDGVVRSIPVAEGAAVRRGDVLLHLVDDVQVARIGLARAAAAAEGELRQAEVQAAEAAAVLARLQAAQANRAASDWEVRQARARAEAARAAVQAAEDRRQVERQRLDLELATLEQHLVRAPFDGVLSKIDTVPGATLTRLDRPLTVVALSTLEAVLFLPAFAWPRLRLGGDYPLHLSDPVGRTVTGRLRHIDPALDAASGRFRAVFVIGNADLALPAGVEAMLDLAALAP